MTEQPEVKSDGQGEVSDGDGNILVTESSELVFDLFVSDLNDAVFNNDRIKEDRFTCICRHTYQLLFSLNELKAFTELTGVVSVLGHCDNFPLV